MGGETGTQKANEKVILKKLVTMSLDHLTEPYFAILINVLDN